MAAFAVMVVMMMGVGPAQSEPAPVTTENAASAPVEQPAPASQPESAPASQPEVTPESAPAPAPTVEIMPIKAKDVAKKKKKKPSRPRAWWSWTGIVLGLGAAAIAAAVTVGGVVTQVVAIYFWYDQTNANRRRADQIRATQRARWTQWTALGLMLGGAAAFFGGLIGATYAFGLGNPDPTRASDM